MQESANRLRKKIDKFIEMADGSRIDFVGTGEKHEGHPDLYFKPQPKNGGKK